jgi:hypothetical protein
MRWIDGGGRLADVQIGLCCLLPPLLQVMSITLSCPHSVSIRKPPVHPSQLIPVYTPTNLQTFDTARLIPQNVGREIHCIVAVGIFCDSALVRCWGLMVFWMDERWLKRERGVVEEEKAVLYWGHRC